MSLRGTRRPGLTIARVFVAASLLGVLMSLRTMSGEQTWWLVLRLSLAFTYAWGALSFLVVAVDRQVLRRDPPLVVGLVWHLPASLIVTGLSLYLVPAFSLLFSVPDPMFSLSLEPIRRGLRWGLAAQLILYWAIVGVSRAVHYYARYQERSVRAVELSKLLAQSQLEALRTQLEPHFLFNALNTISAHVESEPRTARRMIEELGELLRCSLESHEQEVSLSQELTLLNHYLAIQHARFEDRLRIDIRVADEVLDAQVPSQLLQPLVENALRHGLAQRAAGGSVRIEALRSGADLRVRVIDDGVGLPADGLVEGRGLSITRQRLGWLYRDGRAQLDVRNGSASGAVVEITIPWHTSTSEQGGSSDGKDTDAEAVGARR